MTYLFGGYALVELLGLPVDIYNIMMTSSDKGIEKAKGEIAPILNGAYMIINLLVMAISGYYGLGISGNNSTEI